MSNYIKRFLWINSSIVFKKIQYFFSLIFNPPPTELIQIKKTFTYEDESSLLIFYGVIDFAKTVSATELSCSVNI